MSVLDPEVYNLLSQLLAGLSSSENEVRSKAEEQLNTEWVTNKPDVLLMGLVEHIHDSADIKVRLLFLILLPVNMDLRFSEFLCCGLFFVDIHFQICKVF
jgi:hypothetical protein